MKKASIGIIGLIIFSAIMLVILWFIFTIGIGAFMEYTIPSQNAASFSTLTRKMTEGWNKGSVMQNFILKGINPQDTFAIGVISSTSSDFVVGMPPCLTPTQKYCVKLSAKEKIAQCNSDNDLCVCLFRLRYGFNYVSPEQLNIFYTVGETTTFEEDIGKIKNWNEIHFPNVIAALDRLDIISCEKFVENLKCVNNTNPCILTSNEKIIVWIQAPAAFSTITMDRKYLNQDFEYNLLIKTYPDVTQYLENEIPVLEE